jgi:hypothetical protein
MTAADRARVNEFLDAGAAFVRRFNVALVMIIIVAAAGVFLWHSAKAEGERIGRGAAESVMRAMLADSARVIESRVDARYQAIAFAEKAQAAAAASHQTARAKIVLVSDTIVQIARVTDTIAVSVPREIVQEIAASDTLHRADSIAIALFRAQLVDVSKDRDVWQHRALLDEEALKRVRPSRFGFKSGAIVGAVAVVSLVSLLR